MAVKRRAQQKRVVKSEEISGEAPEKIAKIAKKAPKTTNITENEAAMTVELWPIDKPIDYQNNPRKISDKAVAKVADSIKEFGFRQPIVVDEQDVIIIGHTRRRAARKLGMRQVPVHVAKGLSPEKAKALRVMDNRSGEEATWDMDLLKLEIGDLEGLGFDLSFTGFDDLELDQLMVDEDAIERAERTPPVPKIAVTRPGDVWLMESRAGIHRLVCGDATNADDVEKALNGAKPHIMITDIPYGVSYDADWRTHAKNADGKLLSTGSGRAKGEVANDDRADWREAYALFPGDVIYVWHADRGAREAIEGLEACGFSVRAQIIWAKNNFAVGRGDYHYGHEPCIYAVREGKKGHWNGSRKESTLWHIDKPQKSETGHSTQKPIECMRRPIVNNSKAGDYVFDPFLGSSTTLMACELTERVCVGLEISPNYVDCGVIRWQDFTGQKAIHEETGKTFEEMKDARYDPDANSKGSFDAWMDAKREEHEAKQKPKKGRKAA